EAVINYAHRYAQKAMEMAKEEKDPTRKEELTKIAEISKRVPAKPPRNFHEALQFVWFTQVALHQENYEQAISMGRIDQYLYPYYKKDVEAGILDFEKAVELVGCLWIKTNEIIPIFDAAVTLYFSGLPTNQALTIGGMNEEGKDATNELTYVMLEATKRVALRQPNVHLRLHKKSPRKLLEAFAEVTLSGTNNVAIFNDETIIEAMVRKKVSLKDARNYSTIGCVEPGPFGKSFTSSDAALFNLPICLELALNNGVSSVLGEKVGLETGNPLNFETINDVIEAFRKQVSYLVRHMTIGSNCSEIANQVIKPTPLLSLCVEGPFEAGRDITTGSARYNFTGVQGVGLADVADSLAALDQIVFQEKRMDMKELLEALRKNFEGYEELRQLLINRVPKYGNDDDLVDKYAQLAAKIYSEEVEKYRNVRNGWFIPGMYSMTTHIGFGFFTGPLPSGRKLNEPLSNGISPSASSDRKGLTAAMRSVTKIDHTLYPNGLSYTLTLSPTLFSGKEGINNLISLVRTYMELGGMHVHFNIVDVGTLLEAQKDPGKYRGLLVRVAGYSAYFVDLPKEVQDEIICRYREEF
ncbi:MAG: formate C-acetyltransferase/glycerol dehydratase family glycyl radical enzyme, partial [Candidatus Bathyarchaeia archaeon]